MTGPRGDTRPVEPGKQAFSLVGQMEGDLIAMRELAFAVCMAVESSTEVSGPYSGALYRLGVEIEAHGKALEQQREQVWSLLRGYAYPSEEARP